MKSPARLYFILFFLAILHPTQGKKHDKVTSQDSGLVCPDAEKIAPHCICYFKNKETISQPSIECSGDFEFKIIVTQKTLDNVFQQMRAVNHLALNETLELRYIRIYRAFNLTELDLTPFMYLKIEKLQFETYPVTKLLGPTNLASGKIQVTKLIFFGVRLPDESLENVLKYFDPAVLRDLRFTHSAFHGGHYPLNDGSGDVEFLPGLSAFTNLENLVVAGAIFIKDIDVNGGQFKRNIRLQDLNMVGNKKLVIGSNAFIFDQPPPELLHKPIKFAARYCKAIENADGPDGPGLAVREPSPFSRPVELDYSHSVNVEYLKEGIYKPFLDGHPNNTIILNRVRFFVCDERMKWLKDNRELYEHRVLRSACKNDPNYKSIFETDLI